MSILGRVKSERRALTESEWLLKALGIRDNYTGRSVGLNDALSTTTVYACVRVLAETVGSLPLPTYRRLERGKERAPQHPIYKLLHDQPNPEMTAIQFREAKTGHVALRGDAYSEIQRDNAERGVALWPLRPDKMTVTRDEAREIAYVYELPGGKPVRIPTANILHITGFGGNGLTGYSVLTYHREAMALTLAAEEYGARFFGNDSRPGGALQSPHKLTRETRQKLKEGWEELHRGLSNAHRVAVLEEGVTWQQIGIPPKDAQYLELRKFQTAEIARLFRMPPHMIGDLERATFSNIEHQAIEFVVHTLRPWLVRWEQALLRDVFAREPGAQSHFAEHVIDGLLRGDIKSRYEAYNTGVLAGFLTRNEVREMENRNPLEGGDDLLVPLNMAPASQAGQPPAPADEEETE